MGTVNFLDSVRFYMNKVGKDFRFLHVSTDEVFGSLREHDEPFTELSQYAPNSPYSASKAASDHFVRSYYHTHGVPAIVTNCSNNYGPRQNKEKFIPTVIRHALADKPIPVYGNGMNIRDWLWVDDHCTALETLLLRGELGEQYCIGGDNEVANIDLAKRILDIMGKPQSLISYVTDRAGHDFRYAIDSRKLKSLGWQANMTFTQGLERTINWYLQHPERLQ
jgi:dTDP-glucose 4,6-dehydratase